MAIPHVYAYKFGHLAEIGRVRRDFASRANGTLDAHEIAQERLYVVVRLDLIDRASFAEAARGLERQKPCDYLLWLAATIPEIPSAYSRADTTPDKKKTADVIF